MKVKENEGFVVHPYPSLAFRDGVIGQVPGSEVSTFVLDYAHRFKPGGKFIEILLVSKSVPVQAVVAPFNALLRPPMKAGQTRFVATK